nr:hypothetical protein GCM10020093_025570 [Planobispora longispora]
MVAQDHGRLVAQGVHAPARHVALDDADGHAPALVARAGHGEGRERDGQRPGEREGERPVPPARPRPGPAPDEDASTVAGRNARTAARARSAPQSTAAKLTSGAPPRAA